MSSNTASLWGRTDAITTSKDIARAREVALISVMAPVLFMASLVSAAVLLFGELGGSDLFFLWLIGQSFLCATFFLMSLRERAELFGGTRQALTLIKRFSFVALGVAWGAVPGVLALLEPMPAHLLFGAILSGSTMSAALLLQYMPRLGRIVLAVTLGGFVANTLFQPTVASTIVSMVMLVYFGGLAVCTRIYFARYNQRLQEVELEVQRTREINSVLRDVGFATDTCFWSTDAEGLISEVSNDALLGTDLTERVLGRDILTLFKYSPERDLFRARMARGSEIVALELEVEDGYDIDARYWKLSARPHFEDGEFRGYRGSATDITALRVSEQRAAFLTEYDSVTGLLNRNSFTAAITAHLESEIRDTYESALIWIDLDNFKWINDTFGHGGGDEVLKLVTERLQAMCEPMDLLSRYGGDEFALLVARPQVEGRLVKFVEELTLALQQPYRYANTDVQCGASVGLRRIEAQTKNADSVIKEADLALYAAKSSGRGHWKEYSESFKARVRGQRELANDLVKAIEADNLNLQFQPIMDAKTGAVSGVEALSRWYHPVRGAVSPTEFIPVAEDNGIIISLGDRVIEHAIAAAAEMPKGTKIGINISPLQLHSLRLLPLIEAQLEATGLDPKRVELEITESVFLSDNAFILGRLRKLKDLGVRIAMDDFGTGFSSLAYLQRFPFDKLKLDQAFVRGIETSDQSCAIARATISMAHALGMSVTAEGVESDAQARFLREQGCDELQGFLFSRPQDQSALIPYLRSMELMHATRSEPDAKVVAMKR
ncbi:MAG: EAL domain-containing protein [Hyphomonadaceae bacterium]|nr:EAL domain-containing protein [Hyphomonadaceae bacterium]